MRIKSEVNLSLQSTARSGPGYTPEETLAEAMRCLDCPAQYCRRDCPIHTPVPEMCRKIRQGDIAGAYQIVAENNPLTAMTCRVCPAEKQCRKNCTRGIRGEAVDIPALEQFVNDHGAGCAEAALPAPGGKSVAVVGSGPAGLACAAELLKQGCAVTVYDGQEKPGGVPRWGIPDFVLPPDITEGVINAVKALGAEFVCAGRLGEGLSLEQLQEGYDAVFLALGAPVPVSGGFESAMQAQDLLREASLGRDPVKGRSVAVFGGGDTALDAVRVARRLTDRPVTLVYRRGPEEMPARREDAAAAESEGIGFMWWTEPVSLEDGRLLCRRTEPAAPDYPGGRANARTLPGTEFELQADLAVLALGFQNAPVGGVDCDRQGRVLADEDGRTNLSGVFAGGDAVTGPSTVVKAAAAGKRAARAILAELNKK